MAKAKKKSTQSNQLLTLFLHKNFTIAFFLVVFGLLGGAFYLLQTSAATGAPTLTYDFSGLPRETTVRMGGTLGNCRGTRYVNSALRNKCTGSAGQSMNGNMSWATSVTNGRTYRPYKYCTGGNCYNNTSGSANLSVPAGRNYGMTIYYR